LDEEEDEGERDDHHDRQGAADPKVAVVPVSLGHLVDARRGHDHQPRQREELVDYELEAVDIGRLRRLILIATGNSTDSAKVAPNPTTTAVMWMKTENS
jgi:hypothetical protein